jgi:FkbM family methyltransferase
MALVYDVGVHNGDDTAYYLARGHTVVGIDANPAMVDGVAARFPREVEDGRLRLLNVGVARTAATETFWVCEDHDDWSSFDRAIASREGCRHHPIEVATVPFADVLQEHGVPWYCKIDIEGHDRICLESMTAATAPEYVSLELGGAGMVDRLADLGYTRFKFVDQARFWTVGFPDGLTELRWPLGGLAARATTALRSCHMDDWHFAGGSSGPTGPELPNAWAGPRGARRTEARLVDAVRHAGLQRWFDVHAAR